MEIGIGALGGLSSGLSAIGSLFSAFSQMQSMQTQAAMARYQAQVAERQATVAKYNAQTSEQQAAAREEQQRRHFAMLQGQAIAGLAESGTDPDTGSNADMLKQNAVGSELDALNIRFQGRQAFNSFINTSENYMAQANLDNMSASMYSANAGSALIGGFFNAGTNLLTGMQKQAYYQQTGIYPVG